MSITEFAEKHLGQYKEKGKELIVKKCPFCGREKYKFYLNKETGKFICFSGSCNETGTILKLKHKFGLKVNFKETISNNVEADKVLNLSEAEQREFKPMNDDLYLWWEQRGISKETLDYMKVCRRKNAIAFPYLQESEMKMIKYRTAVEGKNKKVWQQEGGVAVLWGLDKVNKDEPVILTEGEPDMLSWIEAGYKNVVSVPFGTSNTDWIDNNLNKIKELKEIYICFDKDDAGKKAELNIRARIGTIVKLKKISLGTYNDVNEALVTDGIEKLAEFYEQAEDYRVDGYYYANKIDIETTYPECTSFIPELDKATGGFKFGEVVIWSAYTGCGKTTLLSQISLSSIAQGYNVCYYTGEDSKEDLLGKIALQLYGRNGCKEIHNPITQEIEIYPTQQAKENIKKDIGKSFIVLEDDIILDNEQLFQKLQTALTNDNARIVIIDNLMQIDIKKRDGESKYDTQKNFVRDLVRFTRKNNIQIHLVAHNKKPEGGANSGKTYDVSGASEIVNLAHMVLGIDRLSGKEKEKLFQEGYNVDSSINVLKKRKRQGNGRGTLLKFDNDYQVFFSKEKQDYLEQIQKRQLNNLSEEEVDELFDIKPEFSETVKQIADEFEGEVVS